MPNYAIMYRYLKKSLEIVFKQSVFRIRIWIQKAIEYDSNTTPDPKHKSSVAEPEPVKAEIFWSEPVWRSGFGSILDKTEEIVNDILFLHSHI